LSRAGTEFVSKPSDKVPQQGEGLLVVLASAVRLRVPDLLNECFRHLNGAGVTQQV
jgi:hypothetical protein